MLWAMAAQLAAVVHVMALPDQLQEQRDAVVDATAKEHESLRAGTCMMAGARR